MLVLGVLRSIENTVNFVNRIVDQIEDAIDAACVRHRPKIYLIRKAGSRFALYLLSADRGLNICASFMAVSQYQMKSSTNTAGSKAKRPAVHVEEISGTPETQERPETDGWITRDEASDMLRCSPQTLKNYESRKLLHPKHALRKDRSSSERVMLVYDPRELAALPSRNPGGQPKIMMREPGEQAARAFELFREGCPLDEIVIELRETPDRIDQLYERWLDQTRARYVITPEAKKAFEQRVGVFTSVTELVELIARKFAST